MDSHSRMLQLFGGLLGDLRGIPEQSKAALGLKQVVPYLQLWMAYFCKTNKDSWN